MSAEQFMDRAEALLGEIRATQVGSIKAAADVVADSLAGGGVFHYHDRGHATGEILHRAGGLFAIHPLQPTIQVGGEGVPGRSAGDVVSWAEDEATADYVLDLGLVREGDVVLVSSVSGASPSAVGLVLAAQRRGAKVVAITSPTYSKAITPQHSSGKFLYEVADVVIDNCGVVGDAMLEIPGLATPAVPGSGLAWVFIVWSLLAQVMRNLTDRGITPQVYKSVGLPDGREFNVAARKLYDERGL